MRGVLYQYLSGDHDRLDALLESAVSKTGVIDMEHNEQPDILEVTKRAVSRAGYEFKSGQ